MDQLVYGFSKTKNISLTYVDVTEAAKKLEQKHLSGPTAGRFLGEALASVALLSADLGNKDERISLQVRVTGPIGGCVTDASREGNLRGYSQIKILNDYDSKESTELKEIVGEAGELTVIHSNSRTMLDSQQIRCDPFNFKYAIARYYNDRKAVPTAVEIVVKSHDFKLDKAYAIKMSRTSEGKSEDFVPLLERFNDHTIEKALAQGVDIRTIAKCLDLDDIQIIENRPLTANCTCSHEKVVNSVACLPIEDLTEIIEKREEPEVICHFCNTTYKVKTEEVVALLRKKQENK